MFSDVEQHFIKNRNHIVKMISFRVGGVENAEDIVQEAYCRALTYIHAYNPNEFEFGRWFSRILSNCRKDALAEQFGRGVPEEIDENAKEFIDATLPYYSESLLELVYEKILEEEDADHREILTLYLIYNYKLREVVEIMDMKMGTVNQILWRFKEKMKKIFN